MKFYEVKCFEPSYTLKKTKSQKKLARVYAYTHAYTQIREGGGKLIGINRVNCPFPQVDDMESNVANLTRQFVERVKNQVVIYMIKMATAMMARI